MRYKRVLLCIPPLVGSAARNARYNDLPEMPFTGIGYLAEFLDEMRLSLLYNDKIAVKSKKNAHFVIVENEENIEKIDSHESRYPEI